MNITDTMAGRDLEALRAAVAGQGLVPGQVGYDQARQGWNLAVDTRPAVVVAAGSAAGVARAVRFARARRMRVARRAPATAPGRPGCWPARCCRGPEGSGRWRVW
jgi:FAD/FMN-containing dehydrogenase